MGEDGTDWTQGQTMLATAAQSALEHNVASYLVCIGMVAKQLSIAAENLAADGVTLSDFAALLRGEGLA